MTTPCDRVIVGLAIPTADAEQQFANVEEVTPYRSYADAPG